MSRRRTLSILVGLLGLAAIGLAGWPLLSSFGPGAAAKNNHETAISLADISGNGFTEFDWNGEKVFLRRSPQVVAFAMPFYDGTYWLPDRSWDRATARCRAFRFDGGLFQCLDSDMESWWRVNARWDEHGNNTSQHFPRLQIPVFTVLANKVILGRSASDR